MKAVFILTQLACVMTVALGKRICVTDYCEQNKPVCANLSPDSCPAPSVYRANHAGQCACCPACVTYLDKGNPCKSYSKELGETPSEICRKPFKCFMGVCFKLFHRFNT